MNSFANTRGYLRSNRENPTKKWEIKDNSKKSGALFFKLDSRDIKKCCRKAHTTLFAKGDIYRREDFIIVI
ncbi:hypothetical protein ACS0TY_017460 [Phlomoides rotata]